MDKNFKIQKKEKSRAREILKLYIFPIIVGIGFIMIVVFLVMPTVFTIFGTIDEINTKNETYNENLALVEQLKTLNSRSSEIRSQLELVNGITTADQTEVVKFRNKITAIIQQNNLDIFSQQLTESDPTIITSDPNQQITLKELPFTFKIEGSYNNIVKFFTDLSIIDDFVIIKEMSFGKGIGISSDGSTVWALDLVLVKYQFNSSENLNEIYRTVLPNVEVSQKVLDYINRRSE